ncbi:MAG: adenylosuccinate synthase [Anaerolineae bacterium]|jgi:adenylosuccinate synthase|nr:adenylosuccinate synthase [Anaerolineae bacterium]
MPVTAVVGAQWGDEGKGRIVDYLGQRADLVVRFQGGDNAGHTVINDYGKFALHLVPSGIFNPATRCLIGAGTVVNFDTLLAEMATLHQAGVDVSNLWIDRRAHVILPFHRQLDGAEEDARKDGWEVGTTKRGIGPAYADKASRQGIRVGDVLDPARLRTRLEMLVPPKNRELAFYGIAEVTVDALMTLCAGWRDAVGTRVVDGLPLVRDAVRSGHRVLLEGQLGVMRDLDWGIYPFTTSSSPTAGGGCVGAGVPPRAIDEVLGIVKAYSTSVGGGPFPTELFDEVGEKLRRIGEEYGATTGRPRRCGWFDGVAIGYAGWLNGFTGIAVTKLDVLDHFDALKLCTGYRMGDQVLDYVPDTAIQEQVEPIYETWAGWRTDTSRARSWDDLPDAAKRYVTRIGELAGVPVRFVSVGPERDQIIVL